MKTALIFYSLTKNTEEAAKQIAEQTGSDIIQIKMVKDIPVDGSSKFFKGGMQTVFGMRPQLKNFSFNEEKYDRIILGMPVWAGKPASPVNTLLHTIKDKNKITAVFTFSGGGDNDKCMKSINKTCHNVKLSTALADRDNKQEAPKNPAKLQAFIDALNQMDKKN